MVAMVALLLLHVPPDVPLVNVVVPPTHNSRMPVLADGAAFTVMTAVRLHPDASAYVITDVPDVIAVITPVEPMVATEVLLLLHVPPDVAEVTVIVPPGQRLPIPEIDAGNGPAVITVPLPQPVGIL
jgi:hypothetical protein